MPDRRHLRWRRFIAAISVALFVGALGHTIYKTSTTSLREGLEDIPYNELTNESIKGRVEFSRSLFQVGLLMTAALWGLIISKKDEAGLVLSDTPEVIMFLCGSALLILSLVDHSIYLHYISQIYANAGSALTPLTRDNPTMPDAFDPNINNFYNFQIYTLGIGLLVAAATLFSAHNLKERK